jgi:hypothetical protein
MYANIVLCLFLRLVSNIKLFKRSPYTFFHLALINFEPDRKSFTIRELKIKNDKFPAVLQHALKLAKVVPFPGFRAEPFVLETNSKQHVTAEVKNSCKESS